MTSPKYWKSTDESIPIPLRNILNDYLLSLKLENKAASTIIKYRRFLEKFLRETKIPLEVLTSNDVKGWIDSFSVGKKPRTVDLVLATLSSFFKFCLAEDYIKKQMMKKHWRPKIPRSLPKYLDEYEYNQIKRKAEELPVRDRALILFLFSTGARVTEVSNLNIEDINLEKRTGKVVGKGKKIRHIHFSIECSIVLKKYLQTRTCENTAPLFMNKFGQRLKIGGIQLILKKLGKQAGLIQPFHPHCCRHTFATNMLARGADLQFIADEMGHNDLNTTRMYARIPTEDMKLKYQNIMG